MRKPDYCLCENKGADKLCSNCTADQRLCFRYMDSIILLLLKSKISSFYPSSKAAQTGLCQTWLETLTTAFSRVAVHVVQSITQGAAAQTGSLRQFFTFLFSGLTFHSTAYVIRKWHHSLSYKSQPYEAVGCLSNCYTSQQTIFFSNVGSWPMLPG